MSNPQLIKVTEWLTRQHDEIIDHEKKALEYMHAGDIPGYRKEMKAKAAQLAALADNASPVLKDLSELAKFRIFDKLNEFSQNANMALELDSVFYMSALLYPDDYKNGEPDNLEKYIESLKK